MMNMGKVELLDETFIFWRNTKTHRILIHTVMKPMQYETTLMRAMIIKDFLERYKDHLANYKRWG